MAIPIIIERMSLTMTEGILVRWLKDEGDTVTKGEPIAEIETDKVVQEMNAPASGILVSVLAPSASALPVGTILGWVTEPSEILDEGDILLVGQRIDEQTLPHLQHSSRDSSVSESHGSDQPAVTDDSSEPRVKISPAAKKRAAEHGVDVTQVTGSAMSRSFMAAPRGPWRTPRRCGAGSRGW